MEKVKLIRELKTIGAELGLEKAQLAEYVSREIEKIEAREREKEESERAEREAERAERKKREEAERAEREKRDELEKERERLQREENERERQCRQQELSMTLEIEREKSRQITQTSTDRQGNSSPSNSEASSGNYSTGTNAISFHMDPFEPSLQSFDLWVQNLEKMFLAYNTPPEQKTLKLASLLKQDSHMIFCQLPPETQNDFEQVKSALMKHYRISANSYRSKLREARRENHETFHQCSDRLRFLLQRWLQLSGLEQNYEGLQELILMEAMENLMPSDIKNFVYQNAAKNLEDITTYADRYLDAQDLGYNELRRGRNAAQATGQNHHAPSNVSWKNKHDSHHNYQTHKSMGNAPYVISTLRLCPNATHQQLTDSGLTAGLLQPTGKRRHNQGQRRPSLNKAAKEQAPKQNPSSDPLYNGEKPGGTIHQKRSKTRRCSSSKTQCHTKTDSSIAPTADKSSQGTTINSPVIACSMLTHQRELKAGHRDSPTPDTLKRAQQVEPTLKQFRRKLRYTHHPPQAGDVIIKHGLLFRVNSQHQHQLIVPRTFQNQVLEEGHSRSHHRHLDSIETTKLITSHFFWVGIQQDIRHYVKLCKHCSNNTRASRRHPPHGHTADQTINRGDQVQVLLPSKDRPLRLIWNGPYPITRVSQGEHYVVKVGTTHRRLHHSVMRTLTHALDPNPSTMSKQHYTSPDSYQAYADDLSRSGHTPRSH